MSAQPQPFVVGLIHDFAENELDERGRYQRPEPSQRGRAWSDAADSGTQV